jgi:two-component system, cell cycle sensor histidine kinase and response regulator CckA
MTTRNLPASAVQEAAAVSSRHSPTVLLVEDDAAVREAIFHVLESNGFRVVTASNGLEALHAALAEESVVIDLVITDVIMPDMGGREMIEWLKAASPDLKVLVVSGHPGEIFSYQSGCYSDVGFLPKPFTPAALIRVAREMLER